MLFMWTERLRVYVKMTGPELEKYIKTHETEFAKDLASDWKEKTRCLAALAAMLDRDTSADPAAAVVLPALESATTDQKTIVACVTYLAFCGSVPVDDTHGIFCYNIPNPGEKAAPARYNIVVCPVISRSATDDTPIRRGKFLVLTYGRLTVQSSITERTFNRIVVSQREMLAKMSSADKQRAVAGCIAEVNEAEKKFGGVGIDDTTSPEAAKLFVAMFATLHAMDSLSTTGKTCRLIETDVPASGPSSQAKTRILI
jgi:hypothetical protein